MVPEKLGLLRSGLRSLVKCAIWLGSGLRFQVKSAGRFRSGLHSTSFFPNCDISHAFNFRQHSPLRTNSSMFLHPSTVSLAAASCPNCTHHPGLGALTASFLLRSNDGVVLLKLR